MSKINLNGVIKIYKSGELRYLTRIRKKLGILYLNNILRYTLESIIFGNCISKYIEEASKIVKGNETVLEVGSGSGYYTLKYMMKFETDRYHCLDLSPSMLSLLKRRAEKLGLENKINIMNTKAEKIPLEDHTVDLVVCNALIHEFAEPKVILEEMMRVLKKDGWVIITDFRDTRLGKYVGKGYMKEAHGAFSVEKLKQLFESCRLDNIDTKMYRHWVIGVGQK